jgi:hypothetical protein
MKKISLISNILLTIVCVVLGINTFKLNERIDLLTVLFENAQAGQALQGQLQANLLMELEVLRSKDPEEAALIANKLICGSKETLDDYLELPTLSEVVRKSISDTKTDLLKYCGN